MDMTFYCDVLWAPKSTSAHAPKKTLLLAPLLAAAHLASAQLMQPKVDFTRADTLRGGQPAARTCYDIKYYHLDVRLDPARQSVSGSNLFRFAATRDFTRLQFDLFANLAVDKVLHHGQPVPFVREANAVFVTFPQAIKKGSQDEFVVQYSGQPTIAKKAPWDGGLVFSKDTQGGRG